jgi:HrpA-like RNA helicase
MTERRNGPPQTAIERERRPQSIDQRRAHPKKDFPQMPMDEYRAEVVESVEHHPNAVIIGETGSGKTTRIPDFLLDSFPEAHIAVTQPRRVAARSVARFVADRRGGKVGEEVGYHVRFEDKTTEGTRVNFMTDGILLRKLQFNPLLEEYDIVMVDEAHERSLNIDFVFGLLRRAQSERKKRGMKELKVITTSATIEKEKFASYFGGSPVVEVSGRMYQVDVRYEHETPRDPTVAAAQRVKDIVTSGGQGDILIFMPGEEEIRRTIQAIDKVNEDIELWNKQNAEEIKSGEKKCLEPVEAMPLFGAMAPEDQDRIFEKNSKRKVIVATNIAETSVTIDGVRFVIDSGFIKQKEFNPNTGIEALLTKRHAKSGCDQRKGRAGRTASGTCYRLYTEAEYKARDDYQTPEIARSNLDHVILVMKKIGIEDVRRFEFIDRPKEEAIAKAIETLKMLGALDANEKLTEVGQTMAELPLRPEIARMVIEAQKYHCVGKICTIAAMMGEKSVFVRPKEKEHEADAAHAHFAHGGSDFMKLLEVWNQWSASGFNERWARDHFLNIRQLFEVREIRAQLMRELKHQNSVVDDQNGKDPIAIQKCIASGLIQHLMVYASRHSYERAVRSSSASYAGGIYIHPSSSAFSKKPQLMIGADIVTTTKTFARRCQPIEPEWLPEVAPQLLVEGVKTLRYDADTDSIIERVSYSLKGHYGTLVEQERTVTDDTVATEQFVHALVAGSVDLPSVKHNADVVKALQALYTRSGGRVNAPELSVWYKDHSGGVRSKREARYIDEQLRLNMNEYCSPEMKTEIDRLYPETIEVQDQILKVDYEYRPADEGSYYESERNEKFRATVTIPGDSIFQLNPNDFPTLGTGGRPEIFYRSGDGYNSITDPDLETLKVAVDNKRLENVWCRFRHPETQAVQAVPDQALPSLESLGARPIAYAKNFRGEDVFVYPAYHIKQTYDYDRREYTDKFTTMYCRTEDEAKQNSERAVEYKNQEDAKLHRKQERETLLTPAKERHATMRATMDGLYDSYATFGLSFNDYSQLNSKWREASYALDISDADPKKAVELMDEIQRAIDVGQQERNRRIALIPDAQKRIEALADKMCKITYDTYAYYGLTYDQYNDLSAKWREASDVLKIEDRYGRPLTPDPEKAFTLIREVEAVVPTQINSREKQSTYTDRRGDKYGDSRPYYEKTHAESSGEKVGAGVFASLLGKFTGKQEKPKPVQPEKSAPATVAREVKPVEKEKMTAELRVTLMSGLANARFFLDSVRAVSEPDKKATNADKISKVRIRAAELKRDLNGVEQEIATTEDAARARGKAADIFRRAERVAEEMSKYQNIREDWPTRFKTFMTKLGEIAKAQDATLDDPTLEKIKTKVAELARSKGEVVDLDGELEAIIIDLI